MAPVTRYARSEGASIAYQVIGDGPLDLLFLTGWITQIEHLWEAPANRRFLERLADFGRLIVFDSRGTGLSDRVLDAYTLEQEATDALAVLDAAGSERAALISYSVGGLVAALLAAEQPQRVGALIMYASVARTSWAPDYDFPLRVEEREALTERTIEAWGEPNGEAMALFAPSMADDPSLVEWFARLQRLAASPSEARTIFRAMVDLDVRDVLPRIRVPTLIMHRPDEHVWDVRHSRYLAAHIPGARYVELEGEDSFPFARFGGREVKTVGDGFLATFDGPPTRALRCALAITAATRELGVEVRVGMHTGECELIGEDVGGMAVHIASRVGALAAPGEVLVSGTVFGTVVGGPFTFDDRGFHELKGVPGRWPLFALGARGEPDAERRESVADQLRAAGLHAPTATSGRH